MSNPYFQFKQFTVYHDKCAMKVGTDGVLLGAWTPLDGQVEHILDVGTGTGLVALQLAQRSRQADIVAVEIDEAASGQAMENVDRSPWKERIRVACSDFRNFEPACGFDRIVSNPPYFVSSLKCPDRLRSMARHTGGGLNYGLLFERSARMLLPEGLVCIIVPAEVEKEVLHAAWQWKFYPRQCVRVYTKPGKPCRRLLMAFSLQPGGYREDTLFIEDASGAYSAGYTELVRDFYLKM